MQWKKERDNLSKNVKLFFGLWKKKKSLIILNCIFALLFKETVIWISRFIEIT